MKFDKRIVINRKGGISSKNCLNWLSTAIGGTMLPEHWRGRFRAVREFATSLDYPVSFLGQSRRLYDCWPLKDA